jgi:proton glutamate symport protein
MKEGTRILVALGAAVIGGAAIAASGSSAALDAADTIAPLGTLWVNAIRMTVIPLVISLLITGVSSTSDVASVGRLGGRTLLVFAGLLAFVAAVVVPLAPSLFALLPFPPNVGGHPALPAGAAEAASQLVGTQHQTLGRWITSLMPTNPIAAAANGEMVPLLVFSILLALAIVRLPAASREPLTSFFKSLCDAMLVLVRWVIAFAPVGVFALVLPLVAHLGAGVAGAIGLYIVANCVACIAVTLLLYPVAAIVGRVPIRPFARAVFPSQLIAFSSSSSIATLPAMVESAEQGLGIPNRIAGFSLPLAVSVFKIAAPASWSVGALFIGWFYGIPLHAPQLATVAFAAVFLAFAAPGIPRGAFIMLAPLFLAIGLPVEGIGILIAVDAIPDLFATVLNVTGDLVATTLVNRFSPSVDAAPL